MSKNSRLIYALSFVIVSVGFFVPLWPLVIVGILIAALSGRWMFATFMGLLIDVAWGPPSGVLHLVYVPFTLVALGAALLSMLLGGYFLDRTPPDTL